MVKCVSPDELTARKILNFAEGFEKVDSNPKRFEIQKKR